MTQLCEVKQRQVVRKSGEWGSKSRGQQVIIAARVEASRKRVLHGQRENLSRVITSIEEAKQRVFASKYGPSIIQTLWLEQRRFDDAPKLLCECSAYVLFIRDKRRATSCVHVRYNNQL